MTIKTFIEKAIEGAWRYKYAGNLVSVDDINGLVEFMTPHETTFEIHISQILLDPLAWQAVGKVEGWYEERVICRGSIACEKGVDERHNPCVWETRQAKWKQEMHRMIDALAEGKTIEKFIETL